MLDAGGSLSAKDLTNLPVAREKAGLVARAFARGGIDAMALSDRDWRLGKAYVLGLREQHGLPLLAANLVCAGERPLPASASFERGGLRIGVVGLTEGVVPGCTVEEPITAARRGLSELVEVDLKVVLTPHSRGEVAKLADVDADLVLMTTSAARLSLGDALPVGVVARGKSLGVLSLHGQGGEGLWSSMQQAALKDEVMRRERQTAAAAAKVEEASDSTRERAARRHAHERERLELARAALSAYGGGEGAYRADLRMVELSDEVADEPQVAGWLHEVLGRIDASAGLPIPDDAPRLVGGASGYLGSDGCVGCHPAQHAQWSTTPHATAWATLRDDQHGRDPACVGCHVTGWRQAGGPSTVQEITAYRGVQCEACHGPSAAHARRPTQHTPVRDPELTTCTACHDGEQDGGRFVPDAYRARVLHTPPHEASPSVPGPSSPSSPR